MSIEKNENEIERFNVKSKLTTAHTHTHFAF